MMSEEIKFVKVRGKDIAEEIVEAFCKAYKERYNIAVFPLLLKESSDVYEDLLLFKDGYLAGVASGIKISAKALSRLLMEPLTRY